MIRNKEISECFRVIKEKIGNDDTINKLEIHVERMERELCGLKQKNVNLNMKLESFYSTFNNHK